MSNPTNRQSDNPTYRRCFYCWKELDAPTNDLFATCDNPECKKQVESLSWASRQMALIWAREQSE
jgi:hypothetical protein